ncbi:uncharacterized protein KY384_007456 [Bacidia gigantensis]|uniref:uncharacterized protein n=1 Tax=Bacidia gigantensis TaxID=2732470 RepID=UPI001D044E09|nr:uncharacterized protein KY384_007456 [Bacidia gigantensis]KAG8528538.1 hypothetical protein KY384_007456 [Bacidia gigantensis]
MPPRSTGPSKDGARRGSAWQVPNADDGGSASEQKVTRKSDNLDRRKFKRAYDFTPSPPNGSRSPTSRAQDTTQNPLLLPEQHGNNKMGHNWNWRRWRPRSPWSISPSILLTTALAIILLLTIVHAFITRQLDPKGCDMCWSRPMYIKFNDFDTEHTRFASKYSLYMIKEGIIDEDSKARCLEFAAADYYNTVVQKDPEMLRKGAASLDFFTVDFNEDFSAFHGQTLLDQAEFVNDAVAYILSLYHDPRRAQRDNSLPDPNSVILIGHSMGGIVARTMLIMPNYQSNSINTIITMSAPHARAPVSVDKGLVHVYDRINEYWRNAYLQTWANDNPLWHLTLLSIAGGGLDTVVPSDYSSLESLVPTTHGFTVFTSGIPNVWTGADHIQTTWCAQLTGVIMKSVYETVDVRRPGQTKPRSERMRIFRRHYLTGMEHVVESSLPQQDASTWIPMNDDSNTILEEGRRLLLRTLAHDEKLKTYLIPVPSSHSPNTSQLTLLSNQPLQDENTLLEVLVCSVSAAQERPSLSLLSTSVELPAQSPGSRRLSCRSAHSDIVKLPASTPFSDHAFDKTEPFSYLQFETSDLAEHEFVVVVDKAIGPQKGWLLAEFSHHHQSVIAASVGLRRLLGFGLHLKLPAVRPMVTLIKVPALYSSLLGFKLHLGPQTCGDEAELFTPLLRQYVENPYESKYFVNLKSANVSLHGSAPFMPPPLRPQGAVKGINLQIWSDPTCNSSIDVSLKLDVAGSMGKLVMRYRLVFAAFPLLVVALVLQKQFSTHDETGKR